MFRNRCEHEHFTNLKRVPKLHAACVNRDPYTKLVGPNFYILHVTNELNTQSCVFLLYSSSQESPVPTLSHFFWGNGASLYSQPGLSSPLASDLTMCSLISSTQSLSRGGCGPQRCWWSCRSCPGRSDSCSPETRHTLYYWPLIGWDGSRAHNTGLLMVADWPG